MKSKYCWSICVAIILVASLNTHAGAKSKIMEYLTKVAKGSGPLVTKVHSAEEVNKWTLNLRASSKYEVGLRAVSETDHARAIKRLNFKGMWLVFSDRKPIEVYFIDSRQGLREEIEVVLSALMKHHSHTSVESYSNLLKENVETTFMKYLDALDKRGASRPLDGIKEIRKEGLARQREFIVMMQKSAEDMAKRAEELR